jgi:hypothetical protein
MLTTVTSASTSNGLPDDGVTAPKHVAVVLMSILKLFLRQFTCASVGEYKNYDYVHMYSYVYVCVCICVRTNSNVH